VTIEVIRPQNILSKSSSKENLKHLRLTLGPCPTRTNSDISDFGEEKTWQKFGKFEILAVVASDQLV